MRSRNDGPASARHDDGPDSAGITGIILGIIGILAASVAVVGFMPLILGIIGLVLGIAGLAVAGAGWSRRHPDGPAAKGTLVGGLALSGIAAILGIVVVVMVAAELQSLDDTVDRLETEIEQLTNDTQDAVN